MPEPAADDAAAVLGGGAWADGAPLADQERQALPAGKSWVVGGLLFLGFPDLGLLLHTSAADSPLTKGQGLTS